MSKVNILLPAMGEGVIEATINKWLVSEGTAVKEEDPIVEVATDKVDSEVPSPATGTIVKIVSHEGVIAKVGEVIAILETNKDYKPDEPASVEKEVSRVRETIQTLKQEQIKVESVSKEMKSRTPSGKFISRLVRSIAAQ